MGVWLELTDDDDDEHESRVFAVVGRSHTSTLFTNPLSVSPIPGPALEHQYTEAWEGK